MANSKYKPTRGGGLYLGGGVKAPQKKAFEKYKPRGNELD